MAHGTAWRAAGVYGAVIGGLFAGESMVYRARDASDVAGRAGPRALRRPEPGSSSAVGDPEPDVAEVSADRPGGLPDRAAALLATALPPALDIGP